MQEVDGALPFWGFLPPPSRLLIGECRSRAGEEESNNQHSTFTNSSAFFSLVVHCSCSLNPPSLSPLLPNSPAPPIILLIISKLHTQTPDPLPSPIQPQTMPSHLFTLLFSLLSLLPISTALSMQCFFFLDTASPPRRILHLLPRLDALLRTPYLTSPTTLTYLLYQQPARKIHIRNSRTNPQARSWPPLSPRFSFCDTNNNWEA